MQRYSQTTKSVSTNSITTMMRARPCTHLCSGDTVGAFIEYAHSFEDMPVFFNKLSGKTERKASNWVADRILDMAAMCEAVDNTDRPLILPIPACALTDKAMLESCINAVKQTRFCNQEISLELTDAAITLHPEAAHIFMNTFRRKGFRVSIDARKSWSLEIAPQNWLLIDTLRIKASDLETEYALAELIESARAAGVAIVTERPYWREGDYLAQLGIDYGLSPRADA